jgi:Tol biopolymer transport system component
VDPLPTRSDLTLSAGVRLGPYEILSTLGVGGMGEVYRARDLRLERDVAIKRISDALAKDPGYLARFEREARMLAALSHPGIGAIYGLEQQEDVRFLVLELVEGESLSDTLDAGPLEASRALALAAQVAEALAAAHEKGVVHRDLKPANVRVTPDGRAKVLDFGLAKAVAPSSGPPKPADSMTATGVIIGTPSYMSPEQSRGQAVDARTDLWAFGCLLYEMLTGKKAFGGASVPDIFAAVLHDEPDWKRLPRTTNASVRRLLQRCLEKEPDRRLGDAREALAAIQEASAPKPRRPRMPSGVTVAPRRLAQITLSRGLEESPVFSPSGDEMAYAADRGGVRKICLRRASGGEERALTSGAFDDIQPSFSPDGGTIAFVRGRESGRKLEPGDVFGAYWGGDVWTIDRISGRESKLVENAYNPSFSPDGARIAFDAPWTGQRRIWTVDALGHNPKQVTSDVSEAHAHLRPRWSPDGRRIVFQNMESTKFDVRVIDLATQKLSWVTNDLFQDLQPVWSPSGRFTYFSSYRSGGLNLWRIAVSPGGKPRGAPQQVTTGAGQDLEPALSPDGRRLAFATRRQNADLWTLPVNPATGRPTGAPAELIATNREDSRGTWSPDGRSVAFNSDRSGEMNIWIQELEGKPPRALTQGPGGDYQAAWSPDGKTIAFFSSRAGSPDIWIVDVATGELRSLTRTESLEINPSFSPDGRFIAFQSDRNGRLEIWVMGADGSAPRALARTRVMGHFLRWTRDGSGVVFRAAGDPARTMRVALTGGEPEPVGDVAGGAHMSFSPDYSRIMDVVGHRELFVSRLDGGPPEKVFEFDDPDARIDYPVWSPDGKSVLFDRFRPQGGDIWVMEGFE